MKINFKSNLLILHITVLVWGFTAILGALITVNETLLVWYRVLIAAIALLVYFKWTKTKLVIDKKTFITLFFTGGIVGLHWILFFGSIKASNVSVAMVCLSSLTLFTSILEPLFNKVKISKLELLIGLLIIIGICLIFKFETQYKTGIIMGLLSALCASIFSIINAKQVKKIAAPIISFYELLSAFIWINFYFLVNNGFSQSFHLMVSDIIYLSILGIVCTAVAYVAGVSVMKELSAFRVALITNLEPVYAILLALMIFGNNEKMTGGFYAGASIIIGSIFLYPVIKSQIEKKKLKKYPHLFN
jgi:drug/metabolite transporter (DMT)-like permease